MDDYELQAHISSARRKILGDATPSEIARLNIDTLHGMWDAIFDAEAILNGTPHICSRDDVEKLLREFAPNPDPLTDGQVVYVRKLAEKRAGTE